MAEGASSLEEKVDTSSSTLKNMDEMRSLKPEREGVSPSSPQSEKLVPYILLPTIVVIDLRKPYTKTEVGTVVRCLLRRLAV
jgi:hypothetical protein